jgi:hypothetical protein
VTVLTVVVTFTEVALENNPQLFALVTAVVGAADACVPFNTTWMVAPVQLLAETKVTIAVPPTSPLLKLFSKQVAPMDPVGAVPDTDVTDARLWFV